MRRMLILSLIASASFGASPALAAQEQVQDASNGRPQRVRNLMLKDGEKCPKAEPDEIVVCGKLDADEMYRIPKEFREPPFTPANTSWANRAETIMEVNRAGLPNSCSPIGTGGPTGCNQQLIDGWYAARRAQRSEAARIP